MNKTYRYSERGPKSAVNLPDGAAAPLHPGKVVTLPDDHPQVKSLVFRGLLEEVKSSPTPAKTKKATETKKKEVTSVG